MQISQIFFIVILFLCPIFPYLSLLIPFIYLHLFTYLQKLNIYIYIYIYIYIKYIKNQESRITTVRQLDLLNLRLLQAELVFLEKALVQTFTKRCKSVATNARSEKIKSKKIKSSPPFFPRFLYFFTVPFLEIQFPLDIRETLWDTC